MPMRPLAVSILISIFVIIGIYETYMRSNAKDIAYRINPNQAWVGIIDMNGDHGIDIAGVVKGEDALLVVDDSNPLFQQLVEQTLSLKPSPTSAPFEIANYDSNHDGILDVEDPISQFFHILIFNPDNQGYELRTLAQAGIRAINLRHLAGGRNHEVIMSDGSRRTLYEINRKGGTCVYKTKNQVIISDMPEVSRPGSINESFNST